MVVVMVYLQHMLDKCMSMSEEVREYMHCFIGTDLWMYCT